jgi:hypothetical protein
METINSQQFAYPDSPNDPRVDQYTRDQFATAHRVYGSNDARALFGDHDRVEAPWPRAPRSKKGPAFDQSKVDAALSAPPKLSDVDPRHLHATQPWVLRQHADYYMTPQYERTGKTSADGNAASNAYPTVYRTPAGHNMLLSGPHRATAALLQGRSLRARIVEG